MACILMLHVTAQDWKWVNPAPSGNQLNCVKLVDATTAFAVGNHGTILISHNGGMDWTIQASNTVSDLLSISAISKDTVYVSTRDLSVLKTTNGGVTWQTIRTGSPGSRNTSQVFFVNKNVGYLLGNNLEEIFKTTDAANTWEKLPVDMDFQGVTSLYFTTPDTGYASVGNGRSGITLQTTDGGLSWTAKTLPISWPFNAITFTDHKTGYLAGDLGNILKTSDAGKNWQILNEFPSNLTNSKLVTISFADKNTGFIAGGKEILKTTNGGLNWKIITQPAFDVKGISFVDTLHGIGVGGDWLHDYAAIMSTTDGGTNWNGGISASSNQDISKIKFANATIGYAVGGNGNTYGGFILKTSDTGNSWAALKTNTDMHYLNNLAIPDQNTLYLVGQYGDIFKSADAGASWQKQYSKTYESLNDVCFLDAQTGYAVGDNQTILKTTNGGTVWTPQACPQTKHLNSAFFKDHNTGYIVSYDWSVDSCTILLTTTDGGLHWKSRHIGKMSYPRKITFVNKETAFIAGDFGAMLKSTDGGIHWTPSSFHGNTYYDLFFTNDQTGYAVGEDGEISMTENCGKDWTVLNSGTDKYFRSVFFTDVNTGFVVGNNAIILKTTNSGCSLKPLRQYPVDICLGEEGQIEPNFIGGKKPLSYLWNNGETTRSIKVPGINSSTYQVTVTDADQDAIQMNVSMIVPIIPDPSISLVNDTLVSSIEYGNHWFRNDTIIPGEYLQQLVPTTTGDYHCVVYLSGCKSEKSNVIHFQYNEAGLEDDIRLQVYPNPVSATLTVQWPQQGKDDLVILTDVHGKEISRQKPSGNKALIDMSHLPQGNYLVRVLANKEMMTKKIVKK